MSASPENKSDKKAGKRFQHLMDNNKFVFVLSLLIAFFIWVAVAMYKSPQESFTVYNIPITIDTENSIVSQRGYVNFWQSDEKIDVTVTGPRYMVTALTADDILVTAVLNSVSSAGISELELRVTLMENSQELTISAMSKTSIEVYFDAELEKDFDVQIDTDVFQDHLPEGYDMTAELTVSTVKLKGPETEVNKIISVVANPQLADEMLYKTTILPVDLNLEGATAADTVSVNKYIEIVEGQEYFVNVNISRQAALAPNVQFTGTAPDSVEVAYSMDSIAVNIDTEYDYEEQQLDVLTLDYADLPSGETVYTVKLADVPLPQGVSLVDPSATLLVTVTVS